MGRDSSPDFEGDYVRPVRELLADLSDPALVGHSMGGLTLTHVQPDQLTVYLSPWWGLTGIPDIVEVLFEIPTTARVIPFSIDPGQFGDLATPEDVTAPGRISPQWIDAMARAQESLPPIDDEDVVFYTPDDTIVSADAIESHTSPDQRRTYDGGHELFASSGREEYVEQVIAELDGR